MIGNMFPILELIWRKTMTRNVVTPTCVTRTHPPGDAHLRVKAPPGPPRPDNASKWKQQFFRMENKRDLVNIWKGN